MCPFSEVRSLETYLAKMRSYWSRVSSEFGIPGVLIKRVNLETDTQGESHLMTKAEI